MKEQILLGQSAASKVTTKDGKNYLVVGLPDIDQYRCRDLDSPGHYVKVHKDDIVDVRNEIQQTPLVARVF